MISESSYLKRQFIGVSEFTLSPSLKITADTFKQVADFCYCGHTVITPFNVAALRTAAELLRMNGDGSDGSGGESLRQKTEYYLCMVVAVDRDFACTVFRSCLSLLPEAELTAFLASRCIEALFSLDDGGGIVNCGEELETVSPEDFRVIADSMQRRFTRSHDLFYRVVDLYFLVYSGKISEEQKAKICSCIDCSILSSSLLMHAVQNPRMPLRFIVQAMLIEQLNTHRSIFSSLNTTTTTTAATDNRPQPRHSDESLATLGAILEQDAAVRQVAQLRAAMDTTSSRIQTLERELSGMKQLLAESEKQKKKKTNMLMLEQPGSGRSSSCRFSGNNINKVVRGERGSVSASMLRFGDGKIMGSSSSCLEIRNQIQIQSPKVVKMNFRQRLMLGLKTAFGVSKLKHGKDEFS